MKYFVLLACISLLSFSCSKKDDGGGTTSIEATKVTESEVSSEMPRSPIIANDASSDDSDVAEEQMDDQQILDIKSAFFQVEQRINKEIGLEFSIDGNNVKSLISKRCESADAKEIKECLLSIRRSLEDFVREGGAVIGENNPNLFRSELVKLSLAGDWLRKINKNLVMVR